ncbi:MAG: hypothetical protein ACRD41_04755 [Candidatus Acidiferrales bacterium]
MNRAFLIVIVPAILTSFCWLAIEWGWGVAAAATGAEIAAVAIGVRYQIQREKTPEAVRSAPDANGETRNR